MDIQQFLDHAREQLMTYGSVHPIFFIEFNTATVVLPFSPLGSSNIIAQGKSIVRTAWSHISNHLSDDLLSVIFISTALVGENNSLVFEKAGKKREVLTVEKWEPAKRAAYMLSVHRNAGRIQNVQTPLEPSTTISYQTALLAHAILLGQTVLRVPDEERVSAISNYAHSLPNEQKQELFYLLNSIGDLDDLP